MSDMACPADTKNHPSCDKKAASWRNLTKQWNQALSKMSTGLV
jgi:hypothetical protein